MIPVILLVPVIASVAAASLAVAWKEEGVWLFRAKCVRWGSFVGFVVYAGAYGAGLVADARYPGDSFSGTPADVVIIPLLVGGALLSCLAFVAAVAFSVMPVSDPDKRRRGL